MKKFVVLILWSIVLSGLSGCFNSIPTEFLETQLSGEASKVSLLTRSDGQNGAWTQKTETDEFDGKSVMSYVLGDKDGSKLFVWTHKASDSQISLHNGDNHICTKLNKIQYVRTIFYPEAKEFRWAFDLSTTKKQLDLRTSDIYPQKLEFLKRLESQDAVSIRTEDTCGTVITMKFNIKGSPHIVVSPESGQ